MLLLVVLQPPVNPRSFQAWFVWGPRVEKLPADDRQQRNNEKSRDTSNLCFDCVELANMNQITGLTFATLFRMVFVMCVVVVWIV